MRHLTPQSEPKEDNMPQISMKMSQKKPDMEGHSESPPSDLCTSAHPVKEGNVYAVNVISGRRVQIPVILKVYSSSFGRYAVFGQNKVMCRECGFVNLKNCTVRSSGSCSAGLVKSSSSNRSEVFSFQIIPHNAEGQSLTFNVSSKSDLEQWLSVLDPSGSVSHTDKGSAPKVIVGSPKRSQLEEICSFRVGSPRLDQKSVMPALVEEE